MSQADQPMTSKPSAEYVLTPGGYRHKSLVHHVKKQHAFSSRDGNLISRNLATGEEVEIPKTLEAVETVRTPNPAWITYVDWTNITGQPISRFSTTWVVPPAPTTISGQTIFIFNALLTEARDEIIQPVLQWGRAASGGGNFWGVASWRVNRDGSFFSDLVPVREGDVLTGLVTLRAQSNGSFTYQCEFQGIAPTARTIPDVAELTWAAETLECYQIRQCSDYPGAAMTRMRSIDLEVGGSPAPVTWVVNNQVTDCGQRTAIADTSNPGGEIDIIYR